MFTYFSFNCWTFWFAILNKHWFLYLSIFYFYCIFSIFKAYCCVFSTFGVFHCLLECFPFLTTLFLLYLHQILHTANLEQPTVHCELLYWISFTILSIVSVLGVVFFLSIIYVQHFGVSKDCLLNVDLLVYLDLTRYLF